MSVSPKMTPGSALGGMAVGLLQDQRLGVRGLSRMIPPFLWRKYRRSSGQAVWIDKMRGMVYHDQMGLVCLQIFSIDGIGMFVTAWVFDGLSRFGCLMVSYGVAESASNFLQNMGKSSHVGQVCKQIYSFVRHQSIFRYFVIFTGDSLYLLYFFSYFYRSIFTLSLALS